MNLDLMDYQYQRKMLIFSGAGVQVLSFLDDIFPALLSSLADTSDEVGPTNLTISLFLLQKFTRWVFV